MDYRMEVELNGKIHPCGTMKIVSCNNSISYALFELIDEKFIDQLPAKKDDKVTIKLNKEICFTGYLSSVSGLREKVTVSALPAKSIFYSKVISQTYRSEKGKNIMEDILSEAEVTEHNLDFEDEEIERFHLSFTPIQQGLQMICSTLKDYTGKELFYFFDREGKFHAVNQPEEKTTGEFKTGKSIVKNGKFLLVEPISILSGEKVKVDQQELVAVQTLLEFVNGKGETRIYVER